MKKEKIFRILSIDGGGILGLYSAEILRHIQERFFPGESYTDQYNLIAGTSTGGIIALGLGLGKDPDTISKFYQRFGREIFPYSSKFSRLLSCRKILFGTKYSNKQLVRLTKEFFGESVMCDAKTHLCIPAIDVVSSQSVVFKTPHADDLFRDKDTKMWEVAVATSSAPTYFPVFSTKKWPGLVDGGLWQNNPSLIATIEALRYFVGPELEYKNLHVLSIGNPLTRVPRSLSLRGKNSLFRWNKKLVELPMKVNSKAVDDILNFMHSFNRLGIDRYTRIASSDVGEAVKFLALDNASHEAMKWMLHRAECDFNSYSRELQSFFDS